MTVPDSMRADLVLENGLVRDPAAPDAGPAEAVAVGGGRILRTGSRDAVRELAGPKTRFIDMRGGLCLPGFMDSHFHFYQWSLGRSEARLDLAVDFGQCLDMVARIADGRPEGAWVLGQGFNESDWPENRMPLRQDLDRAAPNHPTVVWRCDLHLAVANSPALALAGLGDDTPDPDGGALERDGSGRLNGVLREGAINLIKRAVPSPGEEELLQAMRSAQAELHSLGVTGLHDVRLSGAVPEAARTMRCWQRLRQQGELALRTWVAIPGESRTLAQELGLRTGLGDDLLRIGHLKYFLDGGMGARTAWMREPYLDTGGLGMCVMDPEVMFGELLQAHRAGLAVMTHAIGDRAVAELVRVLERVAEETRGEPAPALSHRVEHAQVVRPDDVARLAGLGVPVSVQPTNMVLDINMIDQCGGSAGPCAYPFRSLLDAGVPVLMSSDCPVCDPNPLVGIQGAVTRQRPDGTPKGGWYPDQRVSVAEAVAAYTATPARAYGLGDRSGGVGPGKWADLIVLDRDIHTGDPLDIAAARVLFTVFNGRLVHAA